jgi:YesN/AraC family two-component response regulator
VVLVIDDNPKVKESLTLAFPEYQFIGAANGNEGLHCLRRPHEVDLVILDYKMNGLDGMAVLKEIRHLEPKMGVIILTSYGTKELAIEALRGRADDFLNKPYSIKEMKEKLEDFFEKQTFEKSYTRAAGGTVQRMCRFIERNYRKNPTLQELAGKTSLSPKYISRKFKQETQETFSEYKVKLKMEQARKLLQETSFGIAQIAYRVGYENAESFMKRFKKASGLTPTEYRKKENGR